MQKFNDSRCVARVNGVICGLTPNCHAVQKRYGNQPSPVGHGFVIAQGAGRSKNDSE